MDKKPFLVGISGGSGSGKTFFLNCLLSHLKQDEVALISQDDYYIPSGYLTPEENKSYNFDLPSRIDDKQFLAHIEKLLAGKTVYKEEYRFNHDRENHEAPAILEIKSAPIIVIEGLFIFHFQEIADLIDMKIFIDADEPIALQRRIKRDIEERNYDLDNVMHKWVNHVVPAYKTYLLPHKDTANRVIVNSTNVADDILHAAEEISQELKKRF